MKPNALMISVYMTPSKIKASFESEGDEDTVTYKQKFEGEHPGNKAEIKEFIYNWTGVNAIIIHNSCSDDFKEVIGTKCAPVQLKASGQDDNEARKKMLVFEQSAKSKFVPFHYTGNLVFAEPYAPAGAAFAINAANGYQYKVPSLAVTAAIAPTALDLPDGSVITLIGSGGVGPATLTAGAAGQAKVILKAGTVWTALAGSIINLQVVDGGADKYLVELSRT
jgi:hypothetical protein